MECFIWSKFWYINFFFFQGDAAQITKSSKSDTQTLRFGDPLEIFCVTVGKPIPSIQWTVIYTGQTQAIEGITFYIQGVAKKKWPSLKIWLMWYNFYYRTEKNVNLESMCPNPLKCDIKF